MSKKTWIIIAILFIGIFGFFLLSDRSGKQNGNQNKNTVTVDSAKEVLSDDHVTGAKDKKIVLVEYADFQCPACGSFFPTVQQLRKKYGDKVTFVVRNFPLTNIHQNALAGARAAEAAAKQGKFFEMEKLLFTTQNSWGSQSAGAAQKTFEGFAKQLGLNEAQFKKDFASSETLDRINRDRDSGSKFGAQSTPTFFLNGKMLELKSQGDLEKAIQNAIKEAKT